MSEHPDQTPIIIGVLHVLCAAIVDLVRILRDGQALINEMRELVGELRTQAEINAMLLDRAGRDRFIVAAIGIVEKEHAGLTSDPEFSVFQAPKKFWQQTFNGERVK